MIRVNTIQEKAKNVTQTRFETTQITKTEKRVEK